MKFLYHLLMALLSLTLLYLLAMTFNYIELLSEIFK